MKKEKIKAFVIESIKPNSEKWSIVSVTELMKDGRWVWGMNLITSIEDVVERADKASVPVITRKTMEKIYAKRNL